MWPKRRACDLVLYPHASFYIETAEDAIRVVKQVKRKNVGLTVNLCHELMAGNGNRLPQILDEVAPHIFMVTINGADKKEECGPLAWTQMWGRLIQPLGQGSYDVYAFLKAVRAVGYAGPIGLQCYGLKTDPAVHLKQSMKAWKEYSARLAAEPATGR